MALRAAALLLTVLLAACSSAAPAASGGPPMAHYTGGATCAQTDGTTAARGTSLPSDDGCNTCTCEASGWSCTEMACGR